MAVSTSSAQLPSGGSGASLRQRNSCAVLRALYRAADPLRVTEIGAVTGLSRPTVETLSEGLLEQGWLSLSDPAEGGGRLGRPARTYQFNARAGFLLGADVGAHTLTVCISDLRGIVLATDREKVTTTTSASDRFRVLRQSITAALRSAGIGAADPLACTIGTPGILDRQRRHVVKSPGLVGWSNFDLLESLRDVIDCDVELENDANLAALAERDLTQGPSEDLLYLLLGERMGAGVIANGQLVRGHHGASGEVGYGAVRGGGAHDAGYGPLEAAVNAPALVEAGRQAVAQHPESRLGAAYADGAVLVTAEIITQAAGTGDVAAIAAVRRISRTLVTGIAPALLVLNPATVVVGGGMSLAGPVLQEALEVEFEEHLLFPPDVRLSALGDKAVVTGALVQARSRVEQEIFTQVVA